VRIPNEVLKQRLQTGQHAHVLEAARVVIRGGGVAALFAGTTATLAREVPFYVLGMVAYERLKAVARGVTGRELTPWQTIAVGALSGAIAAVATTPADVLKTRIMTGRAPAGLGALALAQRMVAEEGIASLYKGAAPRALWIAPLGAMNFAGCARPRCANVQRFTPCCRCRTSAFRMLTCVCACRYELAKKALSAVPEPEVAPPTPPAPEPAAATAKARSLDLAHSVTAAGAKAGTRLREAVASLTDSKGAALRRASEAAAASVAASASAAAPRIRQVAEKGAGLLQKKPASSAVTATAAPVALAPVLPAALLETPNADPHAGAAAEREGATQPAGANDSVAAEAVLAAPTTPLVAAGGVDASEPAAADAALPAASHSGSEEVSAGGSPCDDSGAGSSDSAGSESAGGDGAGGNGGGGGSEGGPDANEPPPHAS
jgi:hypothetical protein